MRITAYLSFLMCLVVLASGCERAAGSRIPVAGTVNIDGQPLSSGSIRFVPTAGRPASSAIMADGSFVLASDSVDRISESGVPRGSYRVQVSASKIINDETIHWLAPEKYADFRTSGLEVTIEEPTDDLVIDLTWGDEKPAEEDPAADESGVPPEASDASPSESDRSPPSSKSESAEP